MANTLLSSLASLASLAQPRRIEPVSQPGARRQDQKPVFRPAAPAVQGDRRSAPAVRIQLSAKAIAILNGEKDKPSAQTAGRAAQAFQPADFEPMTFRPAPSQAGSQAAPPRGEAPPEALRRAPPGSQLDIRL